jgi:Domain of unknown function (DUF4287)
MASVSEAVASFERNIEAQTGRSVDTWAATAQQQGLLKHGAIVAWLNLKSAKQKHRPRTRVGAPETGGTLS